MKNLDINQNFAIIEKDEKIIIAKWKTHKLDSLQELENLQNETRSKIIFIAPFCIATSEMLYETHWDEKIIAMEVEAEIITTRDKLLWLLPEIDFDIKTKASISDRDFEETVEKLKQEINNWNINQVIYSREFKWSIEISSEIILAMYKKLLKNKWAYMTYLFNTDENVFLWASPERHLSIENDKVTMNPIAGTMWKWNFLDFYERLSKFLSDKKEIDELSMVIDEELKMMLKISKNWKLDYPLLKESWAVIHTHWLLIWDTIKWKSMMENLRQTLFAPTLVWWPIKSAFEIIKKYEDCSRKYYGWVFWIYDEDFLDTAIVIRSAIIDKMQKTLSVRAWAWVVKDSIASSEANETIIKANWFLWAINSSQINTSWYLDSLSLEQRVEIEKILENRKTKLSKFFMQESKDIDYSIEAIKWKSFLLINSWDDFVYMSAYMIEKMWWITKVIENKDYKEEMEKSYDIVVLWPWYWDINDENDPKMLNLLGIASRLTQNNTKLLWICLWHQAISKALWYEVKKQENISQWEQMKVSIWWEEKTMAFYNSYSPVYKEDEIEKDVFKQDRVLTLKAKNIASIQAHPESIMSIDWFEVLKDMILKVL